MSSSPAVVDVASGAGGGAGAGELSRAAPGLPQPDAGVIATLSKAIRVVPDYPKPGGAFGVVCAPGACGAQSFDASVDASHYGGVQ